MSGRTIRFILTAALLIIAAVGTRPTVAALKRHFTKQRIELRASLQDLAWETLPSFRIAPDVKPYDSSPEAVGTEDWISSSFRRTSDGAVAACLITYYSDPESQVPHTPEVCFRQAGALVTDIHPRPVDFAIHGGSTVATEARALRLTSGGTNAVLTYVFTCNGAYYMDRQQVRVAMGIPGDKFVYFSKIETVAVLEDGDDPADAEALCLELLKEVTRVLVDDHFPTPDQLRGE